MKIERPDGSSLTRVWIPLACALVIACLAGSGLAVPQLRLLLCLQAVIYLIVAELARRNSAWGFGAGFSVAVVCNSLELFATHLFQAGAIEIWHFLHTGQSQQIDVMVMPIAVVAHSILIIACVIALFQLRTDRNKWWKFLGGDVAGLAYLFSIVVLALPR
jgi:hypothetical protein